MTRTANCLVKLDKDGSAPSGARPGSGEWLILEELSQALEERTGASDGYDIYRYSKMMPFVKGPEEK